MVFLLLENFERKVLNAADFSFNEVNYKSWLSNEANTDNWRVATQVVRFTVHRSGLIAL